MPCAGRYVTFPDLGGRVHASASPPCPEFICKVAPLDRRTDRALGTVENTSAQHITPQCAIGIPLRVEWFGGGGAVSTPRLPPPAGGFFRNSDHGKQKFRIFCRKVILIPAQVNPVGVAVDGQLELLRTDVRRTVPYPSSGPQTSKTVLGLRGRHPRIKHLPQESLLRGSATARV